MNNFALYAIRLYISFCLLPQTKSAIGARETIFFSTNKTKSKTDLNKILINNSFL